MQRNYLFTFTLLFIALLLFLQAEDLKIAEGDSANPTDLCYHEDDPFMHLDKGVPYLLIVSLLLGVWQLKIKER